MAEIYKPVYRPNVGTRNPYLKLTNPSRRTKLGHNCLSFIGPSTWPNVVMNSGIRPSLDNLCHHQISFCTSNIRILISLIRKNWHYDRAEIDLLQMQLLIFLGQTTSIVTKILVAKPFFSLNQF